MQTERPEFRAPVVLGEHFIGLGGVKRFALPRASLRDFGRLQADLGLLFFDKFRNFFEQLGRLTALRLDADFARDFIFHLLFDQRVAAGRLLINTDATLPIGGANPGFLADAGDDGADEPLMQQRVIVERLLERLHGIPFFVELLLDRRLFRQEIRRNVFGFNAELCLAALEGKTDATGLHHGQNQFLLLRR